MFNNKIKIVSILTLVLFLVISGNVLAQEKVIIDTDMGQLNDDALVMFMLANSDEAEVLGVTTVAGNTWVEEGTAYALKQLEIIDRTDIPVIPGAGQSLRGNRRPQIEAEQDLWGNSEYIGSYSRPRPDSYKDVDEENIYQGRPETEPMNEISAPDFIAQTVKENPNEVTLFVLGPGTNVALAVREHPEIVPLVKEVIYMGGAFDIPGNTTPTAEFNIWYDPVAEKIAWRTPWNRQLIVPNDIAERVYFTKDIYDRIVAKEETPIVKMYKELKGPSMSEDYSMFVWDAITAAVFLEPDIITELDTRYVDVVDDYGPTYGKSIGYHESRQRSIENPEDYPIGTQKADIVMNIDREKFWDLYVDLLTK